MRRTDGRTDVQTDGRTDKSKAYCPLTYGRRHNKLEIVPSMVARQWRRSLLKSGGGIVRRAKGRGLGRGYAPLQLGVWGLAPRKILLKSSFFALKLRNSEHIFALSRQVNVLNFSLFAS